MSTMSGQSVPSVTSSPRVRALAVVVALGGTLGCSAYSTYKNPPPTGCTDVDAATSVAAAYEFQSIDTFDGEMNPNFFTAGDMTPGAAITLTLGTPPLGAPCGSATALEIQSSGFNDWGSLMGYNSFAAKGDGSAYEGLSFWAHPGVSSNKAFTMLLDDPNTYNGSTVVTDGGVTPPMPPAYDCTKYPTSDGGTTGSGGVHTDPATGAVLSSGSTSVPLPANGCGNQYQAVVTVPDGWQLITVPFGWFQQLVTPNEVTSVNPYLTVRGTAPGTYLITSRLLQFTIRFPKAMGTDIWIDNLAFYRHKGWVPSARDGGVDAP
jgi:hypothetical protein